MATSATTAAPLQRADELLREMTLEEKAMQLASVVPLALRGTDGPMRGQLEGLLGQGTGHIAGIGLLGHKLPDEIAKSVNAIQRYLVTETRLKIPAIFHNEALNGVVAAGFTAFPTPIALAATWDPDAVQEMAEVMRRQMRAVGMLHALAPVMDVARDARRGRVTEWPPNEANILEPALWRLELLVCGDNITPERAFFTISFDGAWPEQGREAIWDHFVVGGPFAAPPPNRVLSMEQSR